MAKKSGPRSCKIDPDVRFIKGKKNVCIHVDGVGLNVKIFSLKDSNVRKLRNWLNWYLDNK